jgi:hypothetical protein
VAQESGREQLVSRSLRTLLADVPNCASILGSDKEFDLFDGLEYYLPEVLRRTHSEWKHESLDGFWPLAFQKTGSTSAELFGMCMLISDQTLTPIHLHIQASPTADEISWLHCKLGEAGEDGMVRIHLTPGEVGAQVKALEGRADQIVWIYEVGFGQSPFTFDPSWRSSTVLALATGIHNEKAFDRLPILADALQDAGCDNDEILNHLRQAGEHCRACWVVNLVLGKSES